jgi:transposase, IS30 family
MKRSHITLDERYLIHNCVVGKLNMTEMSFELGRHRSTLGTELKRGRNASGRYCPHLAHQDALLARASSVANAPCKPPEEWDKAFAQLKAGYSPEQISGRRRRLNDSCTISTQAIYDAVMRHGLEVHLYRFKVRAHLKRPAPRPWHGAAASIHTRSEDANLRIEFGHWEADSALGKKKDKKRTLVLIERQSLYELLVLLPNGAANVTAAMMKRALETSGLPYLSITTDRGSEFSQTGVVFKDKAFACDAYQPNQRGTNENQIGRLRAELPKGQSMDKLTQTQLNRIQHQHNHTPRKCLGYLTPYEVAFNCPPRVAFRT